MQLPLTVSCSSKIHIGFTFLVSAHPGSPGQRALKCVFVCSVFANDLYSSHVYVYVLIIVRSQIAENYTNKSVSSFLRRLSTWHCPHLLPSAVLRRRCCWPPAVQQSIDIPARRAHSSKPAAAECGGRIMGQTDRRTDGRPLHSPCCAHYSMRAASITECVVKIHTKNKQLLLVDNTVIKKMWSRCYQLQAKRKYIFCILLCHPWPIRNVYAVTATNVKNPKIKTPWKQNMMP